MKTALGVDAQGFILLCALNHTNILFIFRKVPAGSGYTARIVTEGKMRITVENMRVL